MINFNRVRKDYYSRKLQYVTLAIFCSFLFSVNTTGQINTSFYLDSINVELIEECFGYKIKKYGFHPDRYGFIPKNLSRIRIESDENGQITNLEFAINNNHSLTIEDFEKCLFPNIKLKSKKVKTRTNEIATKEMTIIFDEQIIEENEYHLYENSLGRIKHSTINFHKKHKESQSRDYIKILSDFNQQVPKEDAALIFRNLD